MVRLHLGCALDCIQVRYMVSEIYYGSKITRDFDRVLMSAYVEKYFCQVALRQSGPYSLAVALHQAWNENMGSVADCTLAEKNILCRMFGMAVPHTECGAR